LPSTETSPVRSYNVAKILTITIISLGNFTIFFGNLNTGRNLLGTSRTIVCLPEISKTSPKAAPSSLIVVY
jgi:hypothetical protein